MSDENDQSRLSALSADTALDWLEDWYHVPALALLFVFMLWTRVQSWKSFTKGGEVFFSGNDAYYHFRNVVYTVHNWPATLPFDPWTYFSQGTSVGQFGTLFDQLIATAALIVGLGSPTQNQIAMTLLFAPPVFAALVAVPTYFIGKRVGGRFGGVFGALILALMPGLFLSRGLVGSADHNIAEPFFQGFAVLGIMIALSVAERQRPVWEQVVDRDWAGLRAPLGWSVLAGALTAFYMWAWPPGVLLVGIFGVFLLLKLTGDYVRGVSPDHVAFVGVVSMAITALMLFLPFGSVGFSTTDFSLLQPLFSLAVAFGAAFMAWLAREWDTRDLEANLYPAAVGGILVVAIGLIAVIAPDLFNMIRLNLIRFIGFGAGAAQRTIAEAQPFLSRADRYGISAFQVIFLEYRMAFFTAAAALVWMVGKPFLTGSEHKGEQLFVVVWSLFMTSAAFTQVRFNYYLVVPVAVLNAFLVGEALSIIGLDRGKRAIADLEWSHVFVVAAAVMLIVTPMVVAVDVGGRSTLPGEQPAHKSASSAGPGAVTAWDGMLEWMQDNTPKEGNYGGAGNADKLDYYGTYAQTDDYDYPAGAYGVMSWWDYGHWITVEGKRIPHANPFQQGATSAANYLLAPNETQANDVLQKIDEDDAKVRYVAVDWQMIMTGSKFGAPTVFSDYGNSITDYRKAAVIFKGNKPVKYFQFQYIKSQRYYDSMMVRLYRYHGSAKQPQPVVIDWQAEHPSGRYLMMQQNATHIKQFANMSAAREYVRKDGTSQIGGVSDLPSEYVPALEHYRLVGLSDKRMAPANYIFNGELRNAPAWVKLFERVPGAEVQGSGPANTNVTASVEMRIPGMNSTFTYTQRAQTGPDGTFNMTLPYSTTGYENWGPEQGYTNVSVRATSQYTFTTGNMTAEDGLTTVKWNATSEVAEGKVIGEDTGAVQVDLEKHVVDEPEGRTSGNETNSTNTSSSLAGVTFDPAPQNYDQPRDQQTFEAGDSTSTFAPLAARAP